MTVDLIKTVLDIFVVISVTVLTIMLPVYVIAFSLVGPSVGRRREEMEKLSAEEVQTNKEAIEQAKSALENKNTEEARQKLIELQNQKSKIEEKREKTEIRYSSLGLKRALLYPSLLLILSAIFFKLAVTVLTAAQVSTDLSPDTSYSGIAILLVLLGSACLVVSANYIFQTLSLVEELGKTVAEFNRQELSNTLHDALTKWQRISESKLKIKISLLWRNIFPPFHLEKGKPETFSFELPLEGTNVVRDAEVWFLLPPGFEFQGVETWTQGADRGTIANHVTTKIKFEKLQKRMSNPAKITILTKADPGTYKGYYEIYSEEYITEQRQEFELIVE
ncbi:MAG: hypothetical protein EPN55_05735 [Gammaproteobacteria bacterium]|nr:MAG: hypothetical protein EPN55_05735 [Gammaproteobacteria bacterium]